MKTALVSILAALSLSGAAAPLSAQTLPDSAEKVKVNGKIMYAHKVSKGETLFSLSKLYGIEIADIQTQNPQVASGLKTGMILYLPVSGDNAGRTDGAGGGDPLPDNGSAASAPGDAGGTAAGADRESRQPEDSGDRQEPQKYRKHIVKWYETLNDIARLYDVSPEAILELNGLPDSRRIKKRQELLIPDPGTREASRREESSRDPENGFLFGERVLPVPDSTGRAEGLDQADRWPEDTLRTPGPESDLVPETDTGFVPLQMFYRQDAPFRIGMLLPLNAGSRHDINSNYLDFYAGALLAVKQMKEEGMNLEIGLYDRSAYASVREWIEQERPGELQLLIGPVHSRDLEELAAEERLEHVPVISPMDPAAEPLLKTRPAFIQAPPSNSRQMENLLKMLQKDLLQTGARQVLLIHEEGGADTAAVRLAETLLKNSFIPYSTVSYGILQGRNIYGTLLQELQHSAAAQEGPAVVLVPSNSEAFVSDVVRNLGLTVKENRTIHLFGMPKWRNFETIDPELFHSMNLHLSLPYFVDYEDEAVKAFLFRYRALFRTEPTPYAFQGYDLTRYFLRRLNQHGPSLFRQQKMPDGKLLQADFRFFRNTPEEGFENTATRNIRYNPDYSVSVLGD